MQHGRHAQTGLPDPPEMRAAKGEGCQRGPTPFTGSAWLGTRTRDPASPSTHQSAVHSVHTTGWAPGQALPCPFVPATATAPTAVVTNTQGCLRTTIGCWQTHPSHARYGSRPHARYGSPPHARYGRPPHARYGSPPQARCGSPHHARYGGPTMLGMVARVPWGMARLGAAASTCCVVPRHD